MRLLALSLLAAASFAGAGGALAQDGGAECQAGSAWGSKPGCGAGPSGGPYGAPGSGRYVAPAYPPLGAYGPYAYDRYTYARPAYPYLRPHRRDRDGDGVRNSRDRYPDNPYRS